MKRFLLNAVLAVTPVVADAQTATIADVVNEHVLTRFQTLADASSHLAQTAQDNCAVTSDELQSAFGSAFDAWIEASHLRIGPTEVENRAFALAFWPDSRGATPRVLTALLSQQDPIISSPEDYAEVSIAARGFYAMEFLIYDDTLKNSGNPDDHCALVQTIAADIAATSLAIFEGWKIEHAALLEAPEPDRPDQSDEDVLQELFAALTSGLQFTSEARLGRPLGTFDRPRPTRAESWRSNRSARHVALNLIALNDLALRLTSGETDLAARINLSFKQAAVLLYELDDPTFAGVADPQMRLRIEIIQQSIDEIRALVRDELGPTLNVSAGFNALDGD